MNWLTLTPSSSDDDDDYIISQVSMFSMSVTLSVIVVGKCVLILLPFLKVPTMECTEWSGLALNQPCWCENRHPCERFVAFQSIDTERSF